jgi:hypothetical protein
MTTVKRRMSNGGRPRSLPNKYDNRHIPKTTVGHCVFKDCNEYGYLGDGLCAIHWDKLSEPTR